MQKHPQFKYNCVTHAANLCAGDSCFALPSVKGHRRLPSPRTADPEITCHGTEKARGQRPPKSPESRRQPLPGAGPEKARGARGPQSGAGGAAPAGCAHLLPAAPVPVPVLGRHRRSSFTARPFPAASPDQALADRAAPDQASPIEAPRTPPAGSAPPHGPSRLLCPGAAQPGYCWGRELLVVR